MVPQFETCGREIHPEFIQKVFSLALTFTYFLRVCFVVWRSFNSLQSLFTVPLTRMTDLLSRRSFVLLSSIYAVFLIDPYKPLELQTKSYPLGRSAVHLFSRVHSLGFSFVRFCRRALGGPFDR